jgi:hypothetical protein
MAKARRGSIRQSRRDHAADGAPSGTGDFMQSIGNFETINGMPHGPFAVAAVVAVAIVAYPLGRLARLITRR